MRSFLLMLFLTAVVTAGQYDSVTLKQIADGVYVHITYSDYQGRPIPSNGLLVETAEGLVLLDIPWNDIQMHRLLQVSKDSLGAAIAMAIVTHAHEDRIGGIKTLRLKGIPAYGYIETAKAAPGFGFLSPEPFYAADTIFTVGGVDFEALYPGGGHTKDNIIVWLPEQKVLYAACFAKSLSSKGPGYIADADMEAWPTSIDKVLARFPDAEIVVPGHGESGGLELLHHTKMLVEEHNKTH